MSDVPLFDRLVSLGFTDAQRQVVYDLIRERDALRSEVTRLKTLCSEVWADLENIKQGLLAVDK